MPEPTIRDLALPPSAAERRTLEEGMADLQDVERAIEPNRLPGAEMAAAHVAALLDEAGATGGGVLVAEDAHGLAGFLVWLVGTEFGCFVRPENQRYAIVSDLWVVERARRTGIGRRLIAEAEARMAAAGLSRVEIAAIAANAPARALYERLGYTESTVTYARTLKL